MITNALNLPGYDFIHYSKTLSRNKQVRIITTSAEIKDLNTIIYLLHPFGANRFFWADFFNNFSHSHCIFVLPESGRNWFINDAKGMRYEDYFVTELIQEVEVNFPFANKRVVGGFSMGGASAFFLTLRYPELFDLAFSLAGAFGAFERIGDPYASARQKESLMIPTIEEHEKVWGEWGSITRTTYNLENLYKQLQKKMTTKMTKKFIFEVGLQDHERIIQMNRKAHAMFENLKIPHIYQEFPGDHTKAYAYQGLNRMIESILNVE